MVVRDLFLCVLLAYLIGTLNPAYLIARLKGFDIRERGSGNAGAANAIITMGKAVGALTALVDIVKAYLAVRLGQALFPSLALVDIVKAYLAVRLGQALFPSLAYVAEISGVFAVAGHIFPFTMGFRGGKGLACLGGIVLAYNVRVFEIMLLFALLLAFITDYICVVPITASVAFPFIYYSLTRRFGGALIYAVLIPIILYKHRENLVRIRQGKEVHFSFLWNKNKELDRVSDKWESDTYTREDLP